RRRGPPRDGYGGVDAGTRAESPVRRRVVWEERATMCTPTPRRPLVLAVSAIPAGQRAVAPARGRRARHAEHLPAPGADAINLPPPGGVEARLAAVLDLISHQRFPASAALHLDSFTGGHAAILRKK